MIQRSTTFRALIGVLLLAIFPSLAAAHPQDGPHVDFRITITDRGVSSSVAINLAFIDHFAPMSRESRESLSDFEAQTVLEALENHLITNCPVSINGRVVEPVIESIEMFANPDPAMLPLFPKSGMRGLIRAVVQLEYLTETPPETVELTWDGYPKDQVSGELNPDGTPPPMTIEAQLRAEGKLQLIRFSNAKPTITWTASSLQADPFAALPPVPESDSTQTLLPLITFGAAAIAGLCLVICLATMSKGKTPVAAGLTAGVMIVAAGLTLDVKVPVPGLSSASTVIPDTEQRVIFEALHANLYKAFDFTDESDVYDALERSVDGPLLEEFYHQIFASLVQAEQGGMLGIVTGVDPGELELLASDENAADRPFAFTARHTWVVEGTVYHWGHSHSRENEYEAEFEIAPTPLGWRIVSQRVLSQRRVDDPEALLPSLGEEI